MLSRRAGLSEIAGLSCLYLPRFYVFNVFILSAFFTFLTFIENSIKKFENHF